MGPTASLIVLLLSMCTVVTYSSPVQTFHIKPSQPMNSHCSPNSSHRCLTLDQFLRESHNYAGGNVALLLLGGTHTLIQHSSLTLRNINSLKIWSESNAIVQFPRAESFSIQNVTTLVLQSIQVICTTRKSLPRELIFESITNFVIRDVKISRSTIVYTIPKALFTVSITINDCYFFLSRVKIRAQTVSNAYVAMRNCTLDRPRASGIYFEDKQKNNGLKTLHIFLDRLQIVRATKYSIFLRLRSIDLRANVTINNCLLSQSHKTGLYIQTNHSVEHLSVLVSSSDINFSRQGAVIIDHAGRLASIIVENCALANNEFGFKIHNKPQQNSSVNDSIEVYIQKTTIHNNRGTGMLMDGISRQRMSVYITDSAITENENTGVIIKAKQSVTQIVVIKHTTVSSNSNGSVIILAEVQCTCSNIRIYNCSIANNNLRSKANRAIGPQESSGGLTIWFTQEKTHVNIERVTFAHNHDQSAQPVTLQIINSKQVTIQDCEFLSNHGTAVQAYYSRITFAGHVIFKQNIGLNGGAIALYHSRMILPNKTVIEFIENEAQDAGGAIFVRGTPKSLKLESQKPCFYQLPSVKKINDLKTLNTTILFLNNTAGKGGEIIYGAPLKHPCFVSASKRVHSFDVAKLLQQKEVIHPQSVFTNNLSLISSDPQRVCLCNEQGEPECNKLFFIFQNQTRFPGEKFNLSVVLVGDDFGTVSGTVYASILKTNESKYTLNSKQQSQEVFYHKCNQLKYSLNSLSPQETLILTSSKVTIDEYADLRQTNNFISQTNSKKSQQIHSKLLSHPIFINITLERCPVGFEMNPISHSCQCSQIVKNQGIMQCEIVNHTGLIYRENVIWISASDLPAENKTEIVIHKCPYHYCRKERLGIDPTQPNKQCAFNHSGILCGGCKENYSIIIGSNRCLLCESNNPLALIVFFIAAGFLLVFFIKVLDLTVAKGTINGLIFYANIAWAYQSILFPPQVGGYSFFKAFLAWVNLDFGIESCFVIGLTAYSKTWLQFLFPFYVWLIAACIILLSRYSMRITNIFGNNSVPVLATLFLISYAKLLRTIIISLGVVQLNYCHKQGIISLWSFNGNIPYFGLKHSFLAITALLTLFFLFTPYVTSLLLVPCLKRKSHLKCLRWINTWKPFFDAYYGPLKDSHHYWVGLLLVIRACLLVLFATISTSYSNSAVFSLILTSMLLLLYCSFFNVYKNKFASLLENLSYVNLIFLGSGVLYTNNMNGQETVIVQISLSLAFAQFVGIIGYHIGELVRAKFGKKGRSRVDVAVPPNQGEVTSILATRNCDHNFKLRESLLDESYTL